MDLLIKGLELPTEERISLSIYPNGIVVNHSTLKPEKTRTTAIELRPHGDLIERDRAIDEMEYVSFETEYNCDLAQEVLRDTSVFLEAST